MKYINQIEICLTSLYVKPSKRDSFVNSAIIWNMLILDSNQEPSLGLVSFKTVVISVRRSILLDSQLHPQCLMHPQRLPNTQIQHNFLTAARDGISPDIPIQPLYLCSLPTATITQPTEDLTRFPSTKFKCRRRLGLQARNGASELQHRFGLMHDLALVDEVFQPVVGGFDLAGHVRELQANYGVVDEFLAEGFALVGVFHGFFVADAGEADALDYYADAFVVEVCHYYCYVDIVSENVTRRFKNERLSQGDLGVS